MSKERPDHHDAEIVLKVYELRREPVLRESRRVLNAEFWPKAYEDLLAVQKADHPLNAPFRQVGTYWEMVYGMVKHGIVHGDYFMESNGEGLLLYAKVLPHLERFRKEVSATAFRNAEWVSREIPDARSRLEVFTQRVRRALEAR